MCWKRVSKSQKILLALLLYLTLYLVVSYALTPAVKISFLSEEFRFGDKYVIMFLEAPRTPVFLDTEGADVFSSRQCGKCFITNNIGFLPKSEYDAILVYGEQTLLSQTEAFMDPEKRYIIETKPRCLWRKFKGCAHQPKVTSYSTRETFDLCGLCQRLQAKRALLTL
ncbi:unnamed protein product [Arctia plantaginis]|uniref:Uncharacterized protein n=1 Tax=Arctia plantaginis TaxID=874455 RepID=A0A8S1AD96_ARCPL|nr:unnamed protein product [Arctia plantaginis]